MVFWEIGHAGAPLAPTLFSSRVSAGWGSSECSRRDELRSFGGVWFWLAALTGGVWCSRGEGWPEPTQGLS